MGKFIDLRGYLEALLRFDVWGLATAPAVGSAWASLESASGLGLLAAGLSRAPRRGAALAAAVGAVLVSTGYATLTVSATVRGIAIANCTCFGVFLAQRLSPWVLAQDAYMVVMTVWLGTRASRWSRSPAHREDRIDGGP